MSTEPKRLRMRALGFWMATVFATVLLVSAFAAPVQAKLQYRPHLMTVGFDTLGEPSNGLNSEIVVDFDAKMAYVGSLTFSAEDTDRAVKAVDISDPTNPRTVDQVEVQGSFGPFDVKIAGDILAASTQGTPESDPGITLMDITDRAAPVPLIHICDPGCSGNLGIPTLDVLQSDDGSHNSFLWADPVTEMTWLFAAGLHDTSLQLFDVTDPANPVLVAWYDNKAPFVHDTFVQENDERVLNYQVGSIGLEILDVTDVVRGSMSGALAVEDVLVGFNHYTSDPDDAATVTRPGFAHYVEPTADGAVTWVGDESGCGDPAIVHSFDTSFLPSAGDSPARLMELGTIIEQPDAPMCQGLIHGGATESQTHAFRWTGHNFDIWGNDLLVRGDYGRGVDVYDIGDPTDPVKVAMSKDLNRMVGDENEADPGRDKSLENYPFVWQAIYDGDLIYASDINQGIYVLDLIGDQPDDMPSGSGR